MFKKGLLVVSEVVLVLAFGLTNVFADDDGTESCPAIYNEDTETWTSDYFCDGRLNAFDVTQTAAVYYSYGLEQAWTDDGDAFWLETPDGITIWTIDSEGVGQLALWVPLAEITPAMSAATDVQIAAGNGVTLNYSPAADAFWMTGPGGYAFVWEAW